MSFSIRFLKHASRPNVAHAKITIGDFEETFESDLSFWSQSQYERQWHEALARIVTGEARSCLITSISDPATANFIFWWPMYALDGEVVLRNQVLLLETLEGGFDLSNPYAQVGPRETLSTEGTPISEWVTSKDDIVNFLRSQQSLA